ncbi:hypothetical protein ACB098_07G075900 [Castanea mollissima]
MASAVLARTTSNGGGAFMAKLPFTNPNPNPNPKKRQQQQQYHHHHHHHHHDESPAVTQSIASDDASSINHRRRHNNNNNHHHNHNNNNNNNSSTTTELQGSQNHSKQYLSINIATYSKKQLRDLKVRLVSELEQIRQLRLRIEHHSNNGGGGGGATTAPISSKKSKGKKRSLALENPISNPNANSSTAVAGLGSMMKACKDVLTKLRKHKSGWVFNEPVDVAGMGLHDYYDIIKQPMDLGTVKSRLARDFYRSPLDFAADVRLTFTNALTYNPKGHLVHGMAEQLLARFEELFRPIGEKIDPIEIDQQQQHHHRPQIEHQQQQQQQQRQVFDVEEELQASSWNNKKNSVDVDDDDAADDDHLVRIEEKSERIDKVLVDRSERLQAPASSSNPPTTTKAAAQPVKPLKQPKPKAKDPNKREMSIEEKHKLGLGLQSLPPEKMEQVVQIIRKRNGHLKQDGDEIELDIEAVDTETLWELDRLVTNWKKMVSKIKRQALMGNNMKNNVELPVSEKIEVVASEAKKPKKGGGEVGEEDVDIGDDMPMCNFPPVEIEKDVGGHASSSSSSSSSSDSDSSSSSDSDSGSSSGSDSDADNAQS